MGDGGYYGHPSIETPNPSVASLPHGVLQQNWNRNQRKTRVVIEWVFGKIKTYWHIVGNTFRHNVMTHFKYVPYYL